MIGSGQRRIGKYELYKHIATNKMSELWIGRDSQSRNYAIVKVFYTTLKADSVAMLQFRQQSEQVAALHHPNIARMYDLSILPSKNPESQFASMVCLVTEYVEGQSLAEYMLNTPGRGKVRPGAEAVQIFAPLSQTIDYAHRPIAIMMQHINTPPTPPELMNTALPSTLPNVILRGLAKEPEKRFINASSMAVALAQSLNIPIPESLSKSANIQSIMRELEDSHALEPHSGSTLPSFSASQKNGASLQQRSGKSAPGVVFPHAARSRARQRSPFNPRLLASILALFLAGFGTVGALLLAPQNNKSGSQNQLVGHAYFVNSGQFNVNGPQGINDEMQLNLSSIPDPPAGKTYYAWLLADRNVSESLPIPLGPLRVAHGSVQLLYHGDAQHTHLLQVASRFLITLDDAQHPTSNPLIDTSAWRYYAEIPELPSPTDKLHFSMLDHLRHLLVESPELSIRGLHGGLAFWFVKNTFAVVESANSAREAWHSGDTSTIREQLIRILDYLDGSSFVTTDVPHGTPLLADAQASQIALLPTILMPPDTSTSSANTWAALSNHRRQRPTRKHSPSKSIMPSTQKLEYWARHARTRSNYSP